jgi:hypothetical protein
MGKECFQEFKVSELKDRLDQDTVDILAYDTCLDTNNAFVYNLKSGEVILLPNSLSDNSRGLIFRDQQCFKSFFENDHFPIENEEIKVQEKYKSEILNVHNMINDIITELSIKVDMKISFDLLNNDSLAEMLKQLKLKRSKLKEKELVYAALVLGEYIRRVNDGNWILLKRYGTFNPYYTPAILLDNTRVVCFWDYLTSFFNNGSISPEAYVSLPYIKNPSLELESNFIKNSYKGYILLK